MFRARLFIKKKKSPKVRATQIPHQLRDGYIKYGTYTQWNII